jgi:hypothetical protein
LVSHTEGGTKAEGVQEQGAEENIWGEWRRVHKEELNDMYSSSNIIWVIKSRRMR